MTSEVLQKLEQVFSIGGSDEEACIYANIAPSTLYNYQKEHPEFLERKRLLKQRPLLKARQTIVANLDNPEFAKWYLERKKKSEFSQRIDSDITSGGKPIPILHVSDHNSIKENKESEETD